MIKTLKSTLVGSFAALLLGASMSASAALTLTAPTIQNSNTPDTFGPPVVQTFVAAGNGNVSFGWSTSASYEGPALFNAGYLHNGVENILSDDHGLNFDTGDSDGHSFAVLMGDTFGFYIYRVNSDFFGQGVLNIFDETFPQGSAVPEPGSLALLGLGLLGVAAIRRRKSA